MIRLLIREGEEPHRLVGAVHELMSAVLPHAARDGISGVELSPAIRRSQVRAACDHDDQLLLRHVPVVGISRLPGREFEEAESDLLAPQLSPQSRS